MLVHIFAFTIKINVRFNYLSFLTKNLHKINCEGFSQFWFIYGAKWELSGFWFYSNPRNLSIPLTAM